MKISKLTILSSGYQVYLNVHETGNLSEDLTGQDITIIVKYRARPNAPLRFCNSLDYVGWATIDHIAPLLPELIKRSVEQIEVIEEAIKKGEEL